MTRLRTSSISQRSVKNTRKTSVLIKKRLRYIQGMFHLIQLVFDGDGIIIKIPDYWFASISQSFLYDALKLSGKDFFYDKDLSTQELEAFRSREGLCVCFLNQKFRVNVELLWHYKEMLTCFYEITTSNKVGASLQKMLTKFKNHIVGYVVESIECSVDYDIDEAEKYLAEYKNHFWCDFDSHINKDAETGSKSLTNAKLQVMETFAETTCVGEQQTFVYGLIVCEGKLILTVNPHCKASCPVFNVDLTELVNPIEVIPTVNKILLMAELARKQMFGEESAFD